MMVSGKYVLRVFVSAKHMTANVVDWNHRRVVASASTVEHSIRDAFEWGRSCNVKAAASIGEVLAMRLKTEEPVLGLGGEVQMDVEKEIEKKVMDTGPEVWAVVNAMRKRGVKVVVHNDHAATTRSSSNGTKTRWESPSGSCEEEAARESGEPTIREEA